MARDSFQLLASCQTCSWIDIIVRLLTLGIFSVEGGAKAWFELILMTAALCASGYILWWQIPLLIAAIFLGTLAAGMFSILAPQYLPINNINVDKQVTGILEKISKSNLERISSLSDDNLEQQLDELLKAKQILENHPGIVEKIAELQAVIDNINQAHYRVTQKVAIQREAHAQQQKEAEEQERQRKKAKEKRQNEEIERKKVWDAWLREQRKREQFTGGCPPDNSYDPPRCRPGYPIKVTLNKKEDGFDGIIWQPSDSRYNSVIPKWCYESVEKAEAEKGKYRFRRPKK